MLIFFLVLGKTMLKVLLPHFAWFFVHFDKLIRPHPGPLCPPHPAQFAHCMLRRRSFSLDILRQKHCISDCNIDCIVPGSPFLAQECISTKTSDCNNDCIVPGSLFLAQQCISTKISDCIVPGSPDQHQCIACAQGSSPLHMHKKDLH